MVVSDLKEQILNNYNVEQILEELGCDHIVNHGGYIVCSNPDGDNKSAIVVYLNDNLTTINFTRQLSKDKRTHDIFDLICFVKNISFPEALKWTCDLFDIDYYNSEQEIPEGLQILRMLESMKMSGGTEDNTVLKPISEKILSYYLPYGNKMFYDDNISLEVQEEFGIGYDAKSNYITIPLRDSLGTICGIKGRYFGEPDEYHPKYIFLEKTAKSQLLFGYYENREHIKTSKILFVFEAEKSVLQSASYGFRNAVSLGGKSVSKTQMELLVRTGVKICLALDKDVKKEELASIVNIFPENIPVYAIIDEDNILDEKQSPSDDLNKWMHLIQNNIYQIK